MLALNYGPDMRGRICAGHAARLIEMSNATRGGTLPRGYRAAGHTVAEQVGQRGLGPGLHCGIALALGCA